MEAVEKLVKVDLCNDRRIRRARMKRKRKARNIGKIMI